MTETFVSLRQRQRIRDELFYQVYDCAGLIAGALELGYMTRHEFDEMLDTNSSSYTDIRNMMAAFVLLSEGEDF